MKLTYESIVAQREAHKRFIEERDKKFTGNGWADTLKSAKATKDRLDEECIEKDDADILVGIIEESMNAPHKRHIDGLSVLFKFSPNLKEDVYENIDDWLLNAEISDISVEQALINIDAYQVTPLKRITCFLYIMQLEEDDVLDLLRDLSFKQSIDRLSAMHSDYIKSNNKQAGETSNAKRVHKSLQEFC